MAEHFALPRQSGKPLSEPPEADSVMFLAPPPLSLERFLPLGHDGRLGS
jgi:hypothetical protein